jgi:Holliday junction resolvase RusA-like endonuclease
LMRGRLHVSKPDLSNLLKFMEDLAVDIRILKDDCLIAETTCRKVYDDNPRTEFIFQEII